MLDRFIRHIREKKLLDFRKNYLLAISGGLDSMVLARLLHSSWIPFSMAHCNFGLRGEESDADEDFIQKLADQLAVKVYVKKFETMAYKVSRGISTQMAARELRYQWFGELIDREGFTGLLLAHHADDQLETILLNMLRGTGIEGFYGMSAIREKIIRPLLPFRRSELEDFAMQNNYEWREDYTNIQTDYKRNFLRHKVVPELKKFDPAALDLLQYSFDRVKDTGKAFFYLLDAWMESNIQKEEDYQYLKIDQLSKASGQRTLLYYWLRPYGFNFSQVMDVLVAIQKQESGKTFLTKDFCLNLDREHLILGLIDSEQTGEWVEESDIELKIGTTLYDMMALTGDLEPDRSSLNAMLDKDKLHFPLRVRNWETGDKFRPLGMKKFKKISDLLIDLKVPLIQKRNIKVLCSEEEIVWVIGLRIDDRYKISPFTKTALYFKRR